MPAASSSEKSASTPKSSMSCPAARRFREAEIESEDPPLMITRIWFGLLPMHSCIPMDCLPNPGNRAHVLWILTPKFAFRRQIVRSQSIEGCSVHRATGTDLHWHGRCANDSNRPQIQPRAQANIVPKAKRCTTRIIFMKKLPFVTESDSRNQG